MNRKGNNTTGWARRLTALLITACLVMAMALPVYAEVDLLPDAPDKVELLEDEPGTASGEDTALPEQNAATPVPEAATPEPEQSAEPEQPAPTETPEPTAEPTLTPEPTATATATPVPTVTPTATPEPTEQPQKMYAARSVDNVQAVSEGGVPDTYTLYFAVPDGWSDYTGVKIYAIDGTDEKNNKRYELAMKEDSKTDDGRKIYSAVLIKKEHYQYGGLGGLEFRGYKGDERKDTVVIVEVGDENNHDLKWMSFKPTDDNYIGGNYYDAKQKKWFIFTVSHKHFAGKEMAFENKTSEPLTDVQAWFYEADKDDTGKLKQVGGPIPLNSAESGSGIAPNSTAKFNIPSVLCSYVQFTWDEGGQSKSSKFYNFYGEDVSDDQESFTYSDTSNCFIYTGANNVRWGIEKSFPIYYDATFSKLPTTGTNDTDGNFSIPRAKQSTVYYRLKGKNKESIGGTMSRIKGTDYYVADVPDGYTEIVFSSYLLNSDEFTTNCGETTGWEIIPSDYKKKEQCFYADTNDDAVYGNGQRGGYWAPKGTKRDAEEWKNRDAEAGKKTPIVDIASADFTEEPNTKYVTSTLYDYYTDYELNGKNRDTYDYDGKEGYKDLSHRNWVTFREFDQALSDYYEKAKAPYPIYTGHFQPEGYPEFSLIADTLNLFGYDNNDKVKFNRFMAINNAQRNEDNTNGKEHTYYAYQGLVEGTANADGAPLLKGTTPATVEPHFNKDFLLGENSKNAKLGEVYENVKFPFTKKKNLFTEDTGVDYWYFDSNDTTLYLKQDSGHNSDSEYFLQESTENKKGNSVNVDVSSNSQGHYGYFPFNETATPGKASTYNYGFGTKLQMDFTLTDDGKVETDNFVNGKKEKTSIKFFFSGDDDVWVFIDGKLALDVGGAHGEVSGLLEFGETETTDGKKNSVTAYVSKVKKGGTSNEDQDKKSVKHVKYNNKDIDFYAKGTTLTFDKGQKHTLTMYYMERGMWGSNMAVAFNFPDNNELQVQKEVDLKNVTDDDFKNCFKNQKIFNFTIQNQATHYGKTDAVGPDESGTQSQKVNLNESNIAAATPGNEYDYIFRRETNPWPDSGNENEQVLHWYARYTDTQSAARDKRRGILTLESPINIEKMRFLTFQVYVSQKDGSDLSLNNLYLELLDNQTPTPGQKGSLGTTGINGATYGSVEVTTDQWVTVKLDLHKMKEQGDFNNNVTTIRVGDNYNRNIYFRNFTFIPKAVPSKMTGFTTDQEDIPDYGSAESGHLENAENAQYTSSNDTDTQLVDKDGRFVLEAGETVTFSDQFRRGSYISLKEDLNQNLYDTTWTVCENGKEVESMSGGKSVSLLDPAPPLIEQKGSGPDDGRTEKITSETEQESGNVQNIYNGQKPTTANTIVFRSYKDPDETSSTLTKLKVKYVNTVKTGGLKIQKQAAAGEEKNITGTYKFKVTFSDVGGAGLEKKDIIRYVEIDMSDVKKYPDHTVTITGIPVGTRYTIEEETPLDGSRLQSVTVPKDCNSADVIDNMVEGVIKEEKTCPITAIFTNTTRKLINIEFDKLWKDANGTDDLSTAKQPKEIYIQLQRRLATSTKDEDWTPVNYGPKAYVTIAPDDNNGWKQTFSGLDQRSVDNPNTNYQYRIVEGTVDKDDNFTAAGKTITIDGNTYGVTVKAEATPKSEADSTGSSTGNTATANSETDSETGATTTPATTPDGTITGGSGKIELTNTLQNPKFVLDIIKKDAEKGENNKEVFLKDVEFKLEKLKAETTEGEPQVDTTYEFDKENTGSITATTNDKGEITKVFTNLEPGTYRLTEIKAHPGYNLLAQPIVIEFTQAGTCSIDGQVIPVGDKFTKSDNIYTMTLTVLNRKTPELPHTGADAPSLWLLIGMPLAVAGLLIFTFRYNRKGGRRH